jgi:hypothetical protein
MEVNLIGDGEDMDVMIVVQAIDILIFKRLK